LDDFISTPLVVKQRESVPRFVINNGPIEKATADAERLRQHACVLIVLDAEGNIVSEVRRDPRDPIVVRVIAVLAPAVIRGVSIPEANVLEIGFSRTRPYTQSYRGNQTVISARKHARKITSDEYAKIHTYVLELMRELTLKLRESWKHKEAWRIGRKNVEFARGIFFSIDKSDLAVYAQMLAEDVRSRGKRYFPHMARRIERLIAQYDKAYSDKQFRKLMGVDKLAFLLGKQREPALYVREILKHVRPQYRIRLRRVVELFGIPFEEEDEHTRLVDEYARTHPSVEGLNILEVRHRKRLVHGKNSFVLEAFLDKHYSKARETPEVPF
jgi:hypothetical protein